MKIRTILLLHATFFSVILNKNTSFKKLLILKNSPIDLIIGRNTVKKHKLFDPVPSQLGGKDLLPEMVTTSECNKRKCDCKAPVTSQVTVPTVFNPRSLLSSLIPEAHFILGGSLPDDDEIDYDKNDIFKPWLPTPSTTDVLSLMHISGDKDLQHRLRTLCAEFKDIFSNELPAAPAKILEFHLLVKESNWKIPKNRAPPCPQPTVKEAALFTILESLLRQGIIRKSNTAQYSQVLLVPKPDKTFRMCIDYRALDDCTPDASWPIPNIAEMLRRIGSRKPKIFGIMDLTQGYHQAPLSDTTKAYTAFITSPGVYEFTRLPFSPKGSI